LTDAKNVGGNTGPANRVVSDWKIGAAFALKLKAQRHGLSPGKVLEYDPPRRLAYSFHPQHDGMGRRATVRGVTFELEQQKDQVKLTIVARRL